MANRLTRMPVNREVMPVRTVMSTTHLKKMGAPTVELSCILRFTNYIV